MADIAAFIRCNQDGGKMARPPRFVIIHGTVSPTERGGARNVAGYLSRLPSPVEDPANGRWASCHHIVDPYEVVQTLPEDVIAWGAPPLNEEGVHIELCDPQKGPASRWNDAEHQAMLDLAAELGNEIADRHGIPMVWLYPDELGAADGGFTDHENVAIVWGQTHHTDPGWTVQRSDDFMARVRGERPSGGGAAAPAAPRSDPPEPQAPDFPLPRDEYFGLITGPADSHGGWYSWEQPHVRAIQRELIRQGYVPGVHNPRSSWADGIYEWPTHEAVARFQRAEKANSTSRYGEVWWDDWSQLFTGSW